MSTGGAKLVVVKASSGSSGLYDSRKRRFIRLIRSCIADNSSKGSQRVNSVIMEFLLQRKTKRTNFRWADLVQEISKRKKEVAYSKSMLGACATIVKLWAGSKSGLRLTERCA